MATRASNWYDRPLSTPSATTSVVPVRPSGATVASVRSTSHGATQRHVTLLPAGSDAPAPFSEDAPSPYAAAGRYVLDRAIFDALRRIPRGAGNELQLTDAIALLIEEGHPVHVVVHRGSRHDLGNPGGYLKAAVDFALERDDYGPELRRWLIERLGLASGSAEQ